MAFGAGIASGGGGSAVLPQDLDTTDSPEFDNLTLTDGATLTLGATTGGIIGATGDKLGFLGKAPIARANDLSAINTATVDATYGAEEQAVLTSVRAFCNNLRTTILQAYGLMS